VAGTDIAPFEDRNDGRRCNSPRRRHHEPNQRRRKPRIRCARAPFLPIPLRLARRLAHGTALAEI
jgi:hypothetical protein